MFLLEDSADTKCIRVGLGLRLLNTLVAAAATVKRLVWALVTTNPSPCRDPGAESWLVMISVCHGRHIYRLMGAASVHGHYPVAPLA